MMFSHKPLGVIRGCFFLTLIGVLFFAERSSAQQDNQPPPRRAVNQQRAGQTDRAPFAQLFEPQGVTWSKEQQEKVKKLRQKHTPKLRDVQQRVNAVYTREQRQARRQAIQKARQAGKRGAALQQAAAKAVELTPQQKEELDNLQKERRELNAVVQREVRQLLTAQQRRTLVRRRQPRQNRQARTRRAPPTHANVKYGPHERNVMDVWLAKSDQPTPLLISIHGGGFRGGNKSVDPQLLRQCLDSNISVAAITYRLSGQAIAPAAFHDAARAVQYLRSQAKRWNLNAKRFAATGGSAGAGLSLWLGFHDDLAVADSDDPVLRQSSRLSCMAVYNGQSSYDPRVIHEMFPDTDTYQHSALAQLYDVELDDLDKIPQDKLRLFEECSPIHHLTKDDAPALLIYASKMDTPITNQGIGIHHPKFGKMLQEKMEPLGIACQVKTGVRRGDSAWVQSTLEFMKKHLLD